MNFKDFTEKLNEAAYGRRDAYQRDYDSSVSGFGKRPREDDEYHNEPKSTSRDVPHAVHINGKKWKSFGSQSHASNVAKKIKGATVHKEEFEQIDEISQSTVSNYKTKADDYTRKYKYSNNPPSVKTKLAKRIEGSKRAEERLKEDTEQIDELSRDTLLSYANKVSLDSQKHSKDPTKRSGEKASRSVTGYARAHNRLEKPVKESKEYDEAQEHLSKANDADAKGDKKSFHAHMANHHDSMSEWHDSKGRSASADKHAEKADYHHEKSLSEGIEMDEAFINGREYASQGVMHPTHAAMHKVGDSRDFYAHGTGDKISGKVTKNDGKEVHIQADKSSGGKTHKFKVTQHLPKPVNEGTYSADVERAFPGGKASGVKTHPVAPVPDKKYIKGTPEWKKHKEAQKPRTGHPTVKEETVNEEHLVHVNDGSKYGDKPHDKDVEHVMSGAKKHGGEFDGHSDKGAFFKFKSHDSAKAFKKHVDSCPKGTCDADLHESVEKVDEVLKPSMGAGKYIKDFQKSDAPQFKGKSMEKKRIMGIAAYLQAKRNMKEEVELDEATVKTNKYSWGTMKTVHHGADFSIPLHPEHHQEISKLKDEQEHKFKDETGRHWTARRKGEDVHFHSANDGPKTVVKHSDLKEDIDLEYTKDYALEELGLELTEEQIIALAEALKGGQKKLDKNHNGKLDAEDFKKLRSEEKECPECHKPMSQCECDMDESVNFDDEGNLVVEKVSYTNFIRNLQEIKMSDLPVRKVTGRAYGGGGQKDAPEHDEDDEKPKAKPEPAVKRGRGRPMGSKSGANQKVTTSGAKRSGVDYTGYKLHLPNTNKSY